jgi:hypothetical protein
MKLTILLSLILLATFGASIPISPTGLSVHTDLIPPSSSLAIRVLTKRLSVGPIIGIVFAALFGVFMITLIGYVFLNVR